MHRVEARIRRYVEADRAAVLSLSERLSVELPPWRDAPSVRVAVASAVSAVLDAESDSSMAVLVAELGVRAGDVVLDAVEGGDG